MKKTIAVHVFAMQHISSFSIISCGLKSRGGYVFERFTSHSVFISVYFIDKTPSLGLYGNTRQQSFVTCYIIFVCSWAGWHITKKSISVHKSKILCQFQCGIEIKGIIVSHIEDIMGSIGYLIETSDRTLQDISAKTHGVDIFTK